MASLKGHPRGRHLYRRPLGWRLRQGYHTDCQHKPHAEKLPYQIVNKSCGRFDRNPAVLLRKTGRWLTQYTLDRLGRRKQTKRTPFYEMFSSSEIGNTAKVWPALFVNLVSLFDIYWNITVLLFGIQEGI